HHLRTAHAIYQEIAETLPADSSFRSRSAVSKSYLSWCLLWTGKTAESERLARASMAICQSLIDESPEVVQHRRHMGLGHGLLGLLLLHRGNLRDSETESRLAAEQAETLANENPSSMTIRNALPTSLAVLSDSLRALGRLEEAHLIHEQLVKRTEPNARAH